MGIAESLGPLLPQVPRRSGAQVLKHSGAQVPKRLSAHKVVSAQQDLADRHAALDELQLALQGTAKSKHPEFEPVKVYLRKATRKAAQRKAEDAGDGDFSDLVERLLQEYLSS